MEMTNVELGIEGFENVVLTKRQAFKEQSISRTGATGFNKFNSMMVVDQYNNSNDVIVRFIETGYTTKCSWQQFVTGSVKHPYDKSVYGFGFLGEGYKVYDGAKATIQYKTWSAMMYRCFSEEFKAKNPTYRDAKVCPEWLCYSTFAKWFDNNYYEVEGQRMELDKDLLIKNNKLYSPDTCVFVPKVINTLAIKRDASRGLPIGIRIDKKSQKNPYMARCGNGKGEQIFLGNYDTPEKAFYKYKEFKEQAIKDIAKEYQPSIPSKLYDALINYEVSIND